MLPVTVNKKAVTVNVLEFEIDPDVARIVAPPTATEEASPVPPMVATPGLRELQETELVRFRVVQSV